MITTDVLIVGAGPAGLTAAITLHQRGVATTIVDNQAEAANTSRAAVVHARTLEMLEPSGVTAELVRRGTPAPTFSFRDRDRVLLPVRFDQLPTVYPYTLMLSQAETEAALLHRLGELGGTVLRPHQVTAVTQDAEHVTATLDDGTSIQARYLVGADGAHSTVRQQAGIGFTGHSYDELFSLADVRLTGDLPRDEIILYFATAGMLVVAPLPHGVTRLVATVDNAPEQPSVEYVQGLLDTRGPATGRAVVDEIVWGSRFRVQNRVADRYRAGRILLAGDAAHAHSPAGGQGMNTGIQDAVRLGGALADALASDSTDPLDAYQTARLPVAHKVVQLADRLTRLATVSPGRRPVRNLVLRGLAKVPAVRNRLAWNLSGLVHRDAG